MAFRNKNPVGFRTHDKQIRSKPYKPLRYTGM